MPLLGSNHVLGAWTPSLRPSEHPVGIRRRLGDALEHDWAVSRINGFVIGPVIAAMFIAVWGMFSASRSSVWVEHGGIGPPGT